MGEYANLQIREDMKRMFGFDPGPIDDDAPRRLIKQPVYERVQCPLCDARPKVRGLANHMKDKHGITEKP
jgi:hypothetical protein